MRLLLAGAAGFSTGLLSAAPGGLKPGAVRAGRLHGLAAGREDVDDDGDFFTRNGELGHLFVEVWRNYVGARLL